MPVGDIYELAIHGTVLGQKHVSTLHFRQVVAVPVPAPGGQALIDDWQSGCQASYRAMFNNTPASAVAVAEIQAHHVAGAGPLLATVIEAVASPGGNGTRVGGSQPLPSSFCAVAAYRSALASKRFRGRGFFSGLEEADNDSNTLQASYTGLLNTYLAAVLATFGPAAGAPQFRWVVFSRAELAATGVPANAVQDVLSYAIRGVPHWLRSRSPGHGS